MLVEQSCNVSLSMGKKELVLWIANRWWHLIAKWGPARPHAAHGCVAERGGQTTGN